MSVEVGTRLVSCDKGGSEMDTVCGVDDAKTG